VTFVRPSNVHVLKIFRPTSSHNGYYHCEGTGIETNQPFNEWGKLIVNGNFPAGTDQQALI